MWHEFWFSFLLWVFCDKRFDLSGSVKYSYHKRGQTVKYPSLAFRTWLLTSNKRTSARKFQHSHSVQSGRTNEVLSLHCSNFALVAGNSVKCTTTICWNLFPSLLLFLSLQNVYNVSTRVNEFRSCNFVLGASDSHRSGKILFHHRVLVTTLLSSCLFPYSPSIKATASVTFLCSCSVPKSLPLASVYILPSSFKHRHHSTTVAVSFFLSLNFTLKCWKCFSLAGEEGVCQWFLRF